MKKPKKTCQDKLSSELLAEWVVSEHLERFATATVAEVAEAYVGIYSARPTSWLAVLARNRSLDQAKVIAMEAAPDLVRIPGMRRSKFLLPLSLAATVFAATRLPLDDHEWRLGNVKLKLSDFQKKLPKLLTLANTAPIQLKDLNHSLKLTGSQASALTTVATYDGQLIRTPSSNLWSSRWLYATAPDELLLHTSLNREQLQQDITNRYIEHYGPISIDDLAWWLAVPKKTALLLVNNSGADEVVPGMWVSVSQKARFEKHLLRTIKPPATSVWFLPAWDPLLMGYAPRSRQRACLGLDLIGAYDASGNGRPVVLIGGRAVTTWRTVSSGNERYLDLDLKRITKKEQTVIQKAAISWAKQIGAIYNPEPEVKATKKKMSHRCSL